MSLPKQIAAAVERKAVPVDGTVYARGDLVCEGARFHSPQPLLLHKVKMPKRTAHLCGTCADNLVVLQALLDANDGDLAWPVRRDFGNQIRALMKELRRE
jgi:hypothetical protein